MDIPVKKLTRLLKPDQPVDVRAAAVVVFAELGVKDAEAAAELVARLDDESDAVRVPAIRAVGTLKIAKALPVLLDRIKGGGEEAALAAEAAAKLGAPAITALHTLMHQVVPGVRRYIAAALAGGGGSGAEVGASVLLEKDPQVTAAAAAAIIGRIPAMSPEQRADLAAGLVALSTNKKTKLPAASELPVVKVLASLNDPAAAAALWEWVLPPHSADVRAAALQAVGGWVQTPTKEQWRRLFACAAETEFRIAAPALMVLGRLPGAEKHVAEWVTLLRAPDMAARRLAMEKVGERDTEEVAIALMEQLGHPDRGVREAARARLVKLDHGRAALASAVGTAATADEAWSLARSLAPFFKTFPEEVKSSLLKQACTYLEADDHRADPLLFLLREADASALRNELFDRAVAKRKKKDYDTALQYLKLLARDPAAGFPMRLELAMGGLKLSSKDVAAESRANDHCLRHFEYAIGQNAAGVIEQIEKAKWLTEDDLFYLGFHFAERSGNEKDFGVAVLKQVVKASPRSKLGTAAKNKLKSVAADS
ncbi:HEAT repeat domain-containing protein [Fimbriiglobus ruber]|uniref:HEAT repeat protein n=1 Tax=Fimbriiglobus ruber TaxID=1908690 RepID=A0A225DP19_9BACT|nr:HEAT repeat domain-containing protein [Fimbriiglobus ruber]OWK40328.1 hypothetical protein FRUB_05247 [Fimbriiglobus ruber]